MLDVTKRLLVWMVFLCSYKEASTYVQAASDSEKDLMWYLISANVLTNTSASMLSDMVGAISDSGVGTTLSKHMLRFCIKNRKNLCYSGRPTQTKENCYVNTSPFVITTNSNKWICENVGWLSVKKMPEVS